MAMICFCTDRPGAAATRRSATPAHLAYIETILDHILVAGPLIMQETGEYNASCFVYDTDCEEEALKWLHGDPYFKAGVYDDVKCRAFRPAAGTWIGGKTW